MQGLATSLKQTFCLQFGKLKLRVSFSSEVSSQTSFWYFWSLAVFPFSLKNSVPKPYALRRAEFNYLLPLEKWNFWIAPPLCCGNLQANVTTAPKNQKKI